MNQSSTNQSATNQSKNPQQVERRRITKNEYLDGKNVPKPAANRWHNLISANFTIAVGSRVHGGTSEIYTSDMQVQMRINSICFPDVVVVSGEPQFSDDSLEILQNPTIVVEVFSNAANAAERAQKLEGYLAIPSVKECLFINEDEMRLEHYTRQNAKQWIYRIYNEREDVITLDAINCKLSVAEVYARVKFRPSEMALKATN